MNVRAVAVRAVFLLLAGRAAYLSAEPTSGSSASKTPEGADDRRVLDLSDDIERLRKNHSLPALAAAVVKNGAIVASGIAGVRVVGERDNVEKSDCFHIASCTKSFTATLAGILVEEEKLSWTTTIGQTLPELRDTMRPAYAEVTLRQLLSHTGGLPAYTNFGPERLAELMALPGTHAQQRLAFVKAVLQEEPPEPRDDSGALYSNAGYAVAACIYGTGGRARVGRSDPKPDFSPPCHEDGRFRLARNWGAPAPTARASHRNCHRSARSATVG